MAEKMVPHPPKLTPAASKAAGSGPSFDYKAVLQHMIQSNASDLHLKVGRPPTLRIDGHMAAMELPALKQEDLRSLAEQIMAPKNIKEFSEQKESDFALAVPGIGRFRVNAYQQRGTIVPREINAVIKFLAGDGKKQGEVAQIASRHPNPIDIPDGWHQLGAFI